MEGSGAFTVKAEVLREGLRDAELEVLFDEVANREVVRCEVTGGEALVRTVEEGEVVALADGYGDLLPLIRCRVDARGVVGAGVEEDDGAAGGGVDGRDHSFEIKSFGLCAEVWVGFDGEVDVGEDLVVVGPRRG